MRGLTLYEPFASLVASGAKSIETRSWLTPYRGSLLIHAAKKWDEDVRADCEWATSFLQHEGWPVALPTNLARWRERLGCAVALVRLAGCERSRDPAAYSQLNRTFGDLSPGRAAWLLADIRALPSPIPVRGSMGLWDVTPETQRIVLDALGQPAGASGVSEPTLFDRLEAR